MNYSIQIPKPCNEPWDNMQLNDGGRHCDQCNKTVVDFTGWEQNDILLYLQQQKGAKVCGRFRNDQLTPIDTETFIISVSRAHLPLYKKLAAILLLAFGMIQMSCSSAPSQTTVGDTVTAVPADATQSKAEYHTIDTLPAIMGKPEPSHKHVLKKDTGTPEVLQGDVSVEPLYKTDTPAKENVR